MTMLPLIDPDKIEDSTPPESVELYKLLIGLVQGGVAMLGMPEMERLCKKAEEVRLMYADQDGNVLTSHYLVALATCMLPLVNFMIQDDKENNRQWTPPGATVQ